MSRVRGALRPTGAVANASSGEVKARLGAKGDDAFRKLQRMFLGAINTLDEDGIKQALVQNQSLIDAKYLEINKPIKDTGSTFLHTAVWHRKLDLVRFLLAHGADPNAANQKGNTALHFACENADKEKAFDIIALLIQAGGDPNVPNKVDRMTPLDKAKPFPGARQFIIAEWERYQQQQRGLRVPGRADANGERRISSAAQEWREQINREWGAGTGPEEKHTDPDEKHGTTATAPSPAGGVAMLSTGAAASVAAATNGGGGGGGGGASGAAVRRDPALQRRADAVREELKKIFAAVASGASSVSDDNAVKVLLDDSEDLLQLGYLDLSAPTDNAGTTLLHTAVWYQKAHLVRWLLDARANPNAANLKGNTPLHFACQRAEESPEGRSIIEMLVGAGADDSLQNYTQLRSPLDECKSDDLRQYVQAAVKRKAARASAAAPTAAEAAAAAAVAALGGTVVGTGSVAMGATTAAGGMNATAAAPAESAEARLRARVEQMRRGSLTAALSQSAAAGVESGGDPRSHFEALAQEMERIDQAVQRAQSSAEEALMAKLRQGRKGKGGGHLREPTMAATQELLRELESQEAVAQAAKERLKSSADEELARRIAARKKKKKQEALEAQGGARDASGGDEHAAGADNAAHSALAQAAADLVAGDGAAAAEAAADSAAAAAPPPEPVDPMHLRALFRALDVTAAGVLPPKVLVQLHRDVHCCDAPEHLLQSVIKRVGVITPDSFLAAVQQMHLACVRFSTLWWDFRFLDARGYGTLPVHSSAAELLWACNVPDPESMRFKDFREERRRRRAAEAGNAPGGDAGGGSSPKGGGGGDDARGGEDDGEAAGGGAAGAAAAGADEQDELTFDDFRAALLLV